MTGLRKIVEALAPHDPINDDEQGCCVHCGGQPPGFPYAYSGRFLEDHRPGCIWVKARRLLRDRIPAARAHDHTDTRRVFEKGFKVQYLYDPGRSDQWRDCDEPSWDPHTQYRINPLLEKRDGH